MQILERSLIGTTGDAGLRLDIMTLGKFERCMAEQVGGDVNVFRVLQRDRRGDTIPEQMRVSHHLREELGPA